MRYFRRRQRFGIVQRERDAPEVANHRQNAGQSQIVLSSKYGYERVGVGHDAVQAVDEGHLRVDDGEIFANARIIAFHSHSRLLELVNNFLLLFLQLL